MRSTYVAALGAAMIATLGVSSAAEAAVIDFGVAAVGGVPGVSFSGGSTLDMSSAFDLDGALLAVSSIGPLDASGLTIFPTGTENTVAIVPSNIDYGTGTGNVN